MTELKIFNNLAENFQFHVSGHRKWVFHFPTIDKPLYSWSFDENLILFRGERGQAIETASFSLHQIQIVLFCAHSIDQSDSMREKIEISKKINNNFAGTTEKHTSLHSFEWQ